MQHEVKDKEDFINFLSALSKDLQSNPKNWKNVDLLSFLESMSTWVEDMGDFYLNEQEASPKNINWQVFADILSVARVYE